MGALPIPHRRRTSPQHEPPGVTTHEGEAMILNARSLRSPGSGGGVAVSCDLFEQSYRQPSQETWSRDD